MVTKEEVQAKLDALPDTVDGIAEYLRERGYKGVRGSGVSCVLAEYLDANASGYWVQGFRGNPIPVPVTVRLFTRDFDNNEYPELVKS